MKKIKFEEVNILALPLEVLDVVFQYFLMDEGYVSLMNLRLVSKKFEYTIRYSYKIFSPLFPYTRPKLTGTGMNLSEYARSAHDGMFLVALNYEHPLWRTNMDVWERQFALLHGKDLALYYINAHGWLLSRLPQVIRENKDIAKVAIQAEITNIYNLEDSIKSDRECMDLAVNIDANAFYYAADTLKIDQSFIIYAALRNPAILTRVHPNFLNSKAFCVSVARAVAAEQLIPQTGAFITFFNEQLLFDQSFVKDLALTCGYVLSFLGDRYDNDHEFLCDIVHERPHSANFLLPEVKTNMRFVRRLLLKDFSFLLCIDSSYFKSFTREFVNFDQTYSYFSFLFQDLKWLRASFEWISNSDLPPLKRCTFANKLFMLKVVSKVGSFLRYAVSPLKDDESMVVIAITNSPSAIKYASARLQRDFANISSDDLSCLNEIIRINDQIVAKASPFIDSRFNAQETCRS